MTDDPGSRVFGNALKDSGLEVAFGLLGDANLAPMAYAIDRGVRFFAARHESGAVCMAAGYAKVTGKVGVATVTRGPGVANAITALVSAARDQLPLVLFAGDAHTTDPLGPQSIDQDVLLQGTGVHSVRLTSAAHLEQSVAVAMELAASDHRPVVLSVPTDFLEVRVPQQRSLGSPPHAARVATPAPPAAETVDRLVARLKEAARPVILVGRGGAHSELVPSISGLAEQSGALLATSLPANGLFHDDEFNLGFVGGFAVNTTRELITSADVVLVLGASLNDFTSDRGKLFAQAYVTQVDHDPAALGRLHRVDLAINATVVDTVTALQRAFAEKPRSGVGYRTIAVAERIRASRWGAQYPDRSDDDGVDPRTVLRAIDERVQERRRIILDIGHFSTFPAQVLRTFGPHQLLPCHGFGSIGLALPTAIGAAVGVRDDTVICVVGDGGILHSLAEVESVGRLGIPLVVVVINDAAYGAEVHKLRQHGFGPNLAQFPPTDFAKLARALGIDALRIDSPSDLAALPESLDSLSGPMLIDAHVTRRVVADKYDRSYADTGRSQEPS